MNNKTNSNNKLIKLKEKEKQQTKSKFLIR